MTSVIICALHLRWGYFYFLGLHVSHMVVLFYFLFFILRRNCISTWLLIWERNVEVGKKQFSDNIKNGTFVGKKKKTVLFFIFYFFQKEDVVLVLDN